MKKSEFQSSDRKKSFITGLCITAIASFLFFFRIGDAFLANWDEAWYAAVSRTMAENGALFSPEWNGREFFEKPPLYFWLSSISYRVFGDTAFSARIFSSLSGAITVLLTWLFGVYFWGRRAGFYAAVILLTSVGFVSRVRTGNMDGLLALLLLAALASCVFRRPLTLTVTIITAFLTKGLIAFSVPAVVLTYDFFRSRQRANNRSFIVKSVLSAAAVVGVWLAASYYLHGRIVIDQLFFHQLDKIQGKGNPLSNFSLGYIPHLYHGMKGWFILTVPAWLFALIAWRHRKQYTLVVYVTAFFIFLSIVESKNNWFLVPLYPFFALITAGVIHSVTSKAPLLFRHALTGAIILAGIVQVISYRHEFFPADVSADEAMVAMVARGMTGKDDVLYLTHYYYPATVYYSRRQIYAVYSEHEENQSWWILPKSRWPEILRQERVFIIAKTADLEFLRENGGENLTELFRQGDNVLLSIKY